MRADAELGVPGRLAPAARASRPMWFEVGWFVLLVVAGGFLSFLQDLLLGADLPVEAALRALLILQILFGLLFLRKPRGGLDGATTAALLLFGASLLTTFLVSLLRGTDPDLALRTLYFMANVAAFLLVFPVLPLTLHPGRAFGLFAALACGFGAAQVIGQDLYLSAALRDEFGIVFDRFVNGRLRASSFFASAPRFAEFLVFLACVLTWRALTQPRGRFAALSALGVVLWLLLNTYSRSGFLLAAAALPLTLVLSWSAVFGRSRVLAFAVSMMLALVVLGAGTAYLASGAVGATAIWDAASLGARLVHWVSVRESFLSGEFSVLLLGSGEAALYARNSAEYYVIDNILLAILKYGGLTGLAAFLLLFFAIYRLARDVARARPALGLTPLLAFYLGLLVEGQFVDNHNTIFLVQFALLGLVNAARKDGIAATPQVRQRAGRNGSAKAGSVPHQRIGA